MLLQEDTSTKIALLQEMYHHNSWPHTSSMKIWVFYKSNGTSLVFLMWVFYRDKHNKNLLNWQMMVTRLEIRINHKGKHNHLASLQMMVHKTRNRINHLVKHKHLASLIDTDYIIVPKSNSTVRQTTILWWKKSQWNIERNNHSLIAIISPVQVSLVVDQYISSSIGFHAWR